MRKSTKLAVVLAAAALLVAGFAFTTLAKGWQQEEGQWTYVDNYGNKEYMKWEKGADGRYYYLDADGFMAVNKLIVDDFTWYVGADGARVADTWVAVEADATDEANGYDYRWYYFQPNGKAIKSKATYTVKGNKYGFDADGKMLFGFSDGSSNFDLESPETATYWYGDNEDGSLKTGWCEFINTSGNSDDTEWYYFNPSNGKKKTGVTTVSGQKYFLDATNGKMETNWQGTSGSKSWFSASGARLVNQWVKTGKQYDTNVSEADDGASWYYVGYNGQPATNSVKTIGGKKYAFADDGKMFSKFVLLDEDRKPSKATCVSTDDEYVQWMDRAVVTNLYYFGGADDGAMKANTTGEMIALADGTYKFGFDSTGKALNGYYNASKRLYHNGLLYVAGDARFEVVEEDGKKYLVGQAGNVQTAGVVADADGNYFAVKSVNDIYEFSGDQEYVAAAATQFYSGKATPKTDAKGTYVEVKVGNETYKVYFVQQ